MSYFSKVITVPKNTTAAVPLVTDYSIQSGIIHRVDIRIPAGHAGLTGIRVLRGLHQIAPVTGEEWFIGDDTLLSYPEHIEIRETPFELTIEAYNTDDTYDHAFIVGMGVLPAEILLPGAALADVMRGVSDILGGMAKWLGMAGR